MVDEVVRYDVKITRGGKFLVIDFRRRAQKRVLPYPSNVSDDVLREVCSEIYALRELMSVSALADIYGVSKSTIYHWLKRVCPKVMGDELQG